MFTFFCVTTIIYLLRIYPTFLKGIKEFQRKVEEDEVIDKIDQQDQIPSFIIQITTRGGETGVINRSLTYISREIGKLSKPIHDMFTIEVLTEDKEDKGKICEEGIPLPIHYEVVPNSYQTRKFTKYKARALHYAILKKAERLTEEEQKNTFIIHLDAESTLNCSGFLNIIKTVLDNPAKGIFQGPIFYPHRWQSAGVLSRQMESLRPFNCYECLGATQNGYPYHLHGSNIVIRTDIEREIGWDFGMVEEYPVVAEDLFFGIHAFISYSADIFAWHGGVMLEQPAFSLYDSLKQRQRWIRGSLQALHEVPQMKNYRNLPLSTRLRFKLRMWYKLIFYSFGFVPASFALIMFIFFLGVSLFKIITMDTIQEGLISAVHSYMAYTMPMVPVWMVDVSLFGALLWLVSIQIGLYHNLQSSDLSLINKVWEHVKILVITPIATVFDTGIVFATTLSWLFGNRRASWSVTPKSPATS